MIESNNFEEKIENKYIEGISSSFVFLFFLFFIIFPLLYNLNKNNIYDDINDFMLDC
jgi:hypothetical protein